MKVEVEKSVAKLGGRIVPDWTDDCTHLIMESLYATEKVLLALIKGAALIDPTWVKEAAESSKTPLLPDPQRHLPQPKEVGFMANALAYDSLFSSRKSVQCFIYDILCSFDIVLVVTCVARCSPARRSCSWPINSSVPWSGS